MTEPRTPVEVIGDSARGEEYAAVRLLVDGETIVEADAPGLAKPLAGLTLLEAAAVPGETLAADALANALAQVFRATPDPCSRCNGSFRFAELLAFTERAGAAVLWTGHYARTVERNGRRLLARGVDPAKDQSYMLATLDPDLLERIAFPLGAQGKPETR